MYYNYSSIHHILHTCRKFDKGLRPKVNTKEMEKLLVVIFMVTFGLGHCSPVQQQEQALNHDNQVANICTTRECIGVSYRILKAMNETADPCDNFYQVIGVP